MRVLVRLLKVILPVAVLGLAAVAAVAMIASRPNVVTQPPPIAPPGVRVHQVNLESVHVSVTSQGTVRPRTETQIVPEVAGRVIWVAPSFASGGFFEQGDVLLRIDPFDYEQAVISARSQLSQARLRLAQEEAEAEVAQREWDALGFGDPRALTLREPQLEEARASVAAAEANLVRSERDLERANVTAPYAGRVRTKTVDVGQFVTVGSAIATIYGVDVAEVRLPLPDEELAYLDLPLTYRGSAPRVGPRVRLRTTFAGSDYEWDGRIVRTESEIDPVSRMVHLVGGSQQPLRIGARPRPPAVGGGDVCGSRNRGPHVRRHRGHSACGAAREKPSAPDRHGESRPLPRGRRPSDDDHVGPMSRVDCRPESLWPSPRSITRRRGCWYRSRTLALTSRHLSRRTGSA